MARSSFFGLALAVLYAASIAQAQQDRAKLVKDDFSNFDQSEYWMYNDLPAGIAEAKETGKPLLIVFR